MNCIWRGVPEPTGLIGVVVLTVVMMLPNPVVFDGLKVDCGGPSCGWLKMLKNSERNSRLARSDHKIVLLAPKSICQVPGPRSRSRGAVPNSPAGVANAAGLIHSAIVLPPGGVRGTPGTRSGRSVPEPPSGAV